MITDRERELRAVRKKRYYARHGERLRAEARERQANRRDRAQELSAVAYAETRGVAIANLGGRCAVCGTAERLELDHIEPVRGPRRQKAEWRRAARGDTENLQLLCHDDHLAKTRGEK